MVQAGLRDGCFWEFQGYLWEFHGYLSNQLAPFSRDFPRNIPGNIPRLAKTLRWCWRSKLEYLVLSLLLSACNKHANKWWIFRKKCDTLIRFFFHFPYFRSIFHQVISKISVKLVDLLWFNSGLNSEGICEHWNTFSIKTKYSNTFLHYYYYHYYYCHCYYIFYWSEWVAPTDAHLTTCCKKFEHPWYKVLLCSGSFSEWTRTALKIISSSWQPVIRSFGRQ